ncbi:hypothetical protein [Halobacillus naozhouensis]|uniref:Uncharacterized protein n=1 Tax=Halobacillus naozhouensis TaxID=554880 RepID=A0ABY8IXZ2_9BACI|nr:hypothetical protein [Halobacillus naozhouensis]WFT74164.1 hypothetical protein P9989_17635 [Halobacillus naozhouensis]
MVITVELLKVLNAIARAVSKRDEQFVWEFAVYTANGFEYEYMHHLDERKFYNELLNIAQATGNEDDYRSLMEEVSKQYEGSSVKYNDSILQKN